VSGVPTADLAVRSETAVLLRSAPLRRCEINTTASVLSEAMMLAAVRIRAGSSALNSKITQESANAATTTADAIAVRLNQRKWGGNDAIISKFT
jgi:hypothetical protein